MLSSGQGPGRRKHLLFPVAEVEPEFRSWGAHPPRVWLDAPSRPARCPFAAQGRLELFCACGFSARARKTAPGAGALPFYFGSRVEPNPQNRRTHQMTITSKNYANLVFRVWRESLGAFRFWPGRSRPGVRPNKVLPASCRQISSPFGVPASAGPAVGSSKLAVERSMFALSFPFPFAPLREPAQVSGLFQFPLSTFSATPSPHRFHHRRLRPFHAPTRRPAGCQLQLQPQFLLIAFQRIIPKPGRPQCFPVLPGHRPP